jgi:hypothetical protein
MSLEILERAVEEKTGMLINELREMTVSEMRDRVQRREKRPTTFYSAFPFIGRGSVMHDCMVSHEEVERELDEALR